MDHEPDHLESATAWTDRLEVHVKYAPFIQGERSRVTVYLTRLDTFRPPSKSSVEVVVRFENGRTDSVTASEPARAGVFQLDVRPTASGKATLTVKASGDASGEVGFPPVDVFANKALSAHQHNDPPADLVTLTKEQQWTVDFAAAVTRLDSLRASVSVPAEVIARSGGESEVSAPFDGRLLIRNVPALGTRVEKGDALAAIVPPARDPADLATLELAKAEAQTHLDLARRERDRAERLVEAGAAPAKRLEEARALEATVSARLKAAESRLSFYTKSRAAEGGDGMEFTLRAPISGVLAEIHAANGTNVRAGDAIFRIVDTERVYVSAVVPASDYTSMRELTGAEIDDGGPPRPLGKLVSVGRIVDKATRTFPVIYESANADSRLAIHQMVEVRLFLRGTRPAVLLPETAIIDDAGRPVVYVQRGGETFERRPVKTGSAQSGLTEITEGVKAGERVVMRGAYLVRLAALGGQLPEEGHVH